jgi:GH35 family endo-1,4-beta-xylanase
MKQRTPFLFLSTLALAMPGQASQADTTHIWETNAATRIEQHRKEDFTIEIRHGEKPLAGVQIQLDMEQHEFLFGCNIFKWGNCETALQNEKYQQSFATVFNFATLPFYWSSYEPQKDNPHKAAERNKRIAAWCASQKIRTKGHPLAWNYYDPAWASSIDDAELYKRQMARITENIAQFSGQIDTWDVINEVTEWDREDCQKRAPRTTRIMKAHGVSPYVKACFEAARNGLGDKMLDDTKPSPLLLINDYETSEAYATLLASLTTPEDKPAYDAIGIQSHMHADLWNNEKIREVCDRFARFGKPLHFTELTLLSTREKFKWDQHAPIGPTTPEGEMWQRDELVRIYTMLFSHPAVEAITWWDFSDQGAWMNAPAGLIRKDMSPKPAYNALKKLITKDWATHTTLKTDTTGKATTRAFRGNYTITLTLPGEKESITLTHKIKRGTENKILIKTPSKKGK